VLILQKYIIIGQVSEWICVCAKEERLSFPDKSAIH